MRKFFWGLTAAIVLFSGAASAETEWIYKEVTGDAKNYPRCLEKPQAIEKAGIEKMLTSNAKYHCRDMGYGWHMAELKSLGETVCDECEGPEKAGKYRCRQANLVVQCRRIRPGSVGMGMLPWSPKPYE